MPHSIPRAATPFLTLCLAMSAMESDALAQSGSRDAGAAAVAAPAGDESTNGEAEAGGWLFRSRLLNVGRPEVTPPAVEWNGATIDQAALEGRSRLMQPIHRVREAAQGAVQRTRDKWNETVERMKVRRDGAAPPLLARWWGGETPPDAAVAQQPGSTVTR